MSFLYFAFNYLQWLSYWTLSCNFSDNAWQRQENILKKLTKQPACATTSFNSNCNSKIRLIVFLKSCIFSIPEYHPFFYCVVLLRCVGKISSQFKCCVVVPAFKYIYFIYPNAQSIPSIPILPGNFSGILFLQWAFFIDKSFIWVGNFSLFN